ncbi:MAG: NAD-dependent epimerase/dehydratase family protein, partial [Chitinophagaceae bacterium]
PCTDLTDMEFPAKLASYAREVAMTFPWIKYYTPVNEPLTTARFSGLYGIWYPHGTSDELFARTFINQLRGIVLSMQAIREINPAAELVQTEDLSKTHSTPLLAYQAAFENERRWLTYDFLTGKVDRQHFAWKYFKKLNIGDEELQFFLDNTTPPSIAGFNYYVTSERYLDEQIHNYPKCIHGSNGIHEYADTEAARSMHMQGAGTLLTEAWWRYKIPMALTECQLTCTREQQIRWLHHHWKLATKLNKQGIPLVAVTAWALLGSMDWDSLLSRNDQHYDAGVFAVGTAGIRSTALAPMIKDLAAGATYTHPALEGAGWWQRPGPLAFDNAPVLQSGARTPLLILGSNGTPGKAFCKLCVERGLTYIALSHQQLDITSAQAVEEAIVAYKPWAIINTSGYENLDQAESNPLTCVRMNSDAPAGIAALCKKHGVQFLHFSTDMVFDGQKDLPYIESDEVRPINAYGRSKAAGEKSVLENFETSLIIRTSTCFSSWDKNNFAEDVIESIRRGVPFHAPSDITVSPTYIPDLVNTSLDLLIDKAAGIWHVTNAGQISLFDFAVELAAALQKKNSCIVQTNRHEMGWIAKRPAFSALKSRQSIDLPSLDNAIHRFIHHAKS